MLGALSSWHRRMQLGLKEARKEEFGLGAGRRERDPGSGCGAGGGCWNHSRFPSALGVVGAGSGVSPAALWTPHDPTV